MRSSGTSPQGSIRLIIRQRTFPHAGLTRGLGQCAGMSPEDYADRYERCPVGVRGNAGVVGRDA